MHAAAAVCVCVCVCVGVWIDVVSRDLVEVPNWQETVKDRKAWRVVIH